MHLTTPDLAPENNLFIACTFLKIFLQLHAGHRSIDNLINLSIWQNFFLSTPQSEQNKPIEANLN